MSWPARQGDTFDPATMATWVMDRTDLDHMTAYFEDARKITFDLETTGLDEHAETDGRSNGGVAARIVLATFTVPTRLEDVGDEPITFILPLSHPHSPWSGYWRNVITAVFAVIRKLNILLEGQNVKFDARWIYAMTGIDVTDLLHWDTRVSSHLLDENESTALKPRASATFGIPQWDDDVDFRTPGAAEKIDMIDLGVYGARDTYWTYRLSDLHQDMMNLNEKTAEEPMDSEAVELARLGELATYVAMPTSKTLTAMEQRGLPLDLDYTKEKLSEAEGIAAEVKSELAVMFPEAGLDPQEASFAPTSLWFRAWSEAAVEAGALRIVSLTKQGKAQWSKRVLNHLDRNGFDVATKLLRYRDYAKRAEFLRSWLDKVSARGTIHTTYNIGSVLTGRLSSQGPNMQQVTKSLRPCFVPPEGHYLVDIDYSQLELRVAAHISQCVPMIEAFQRGDDLHNLFGAKLTGKDPKDVTPEERQKAKSANFGLLFEMGPEGFQIYAEDAYGVTMDSEEAAQIHRAFFQMWTGLSAWHASAKRKAHQTGQVVSPIGRVRRLPDIYSGNEHLVRNAERQAINSPVQGFGSDLMQTAAASIEGNLPGVPPVKGAILLGTVHDSIIGAVPKDNWEEITQQMIDRMVNVHEYLHKRMNVEFTVPLAAEATVGTRWGWDDIGTL